jgi:hypothetical protein
MTNDKEWRVGQVTELAHDGAKAFTGRAVSVGRLRAVGNMPSNTKRYWSCKSLHISLELILWIHRTRRFAANKKSRKHGTSRY